MSFKGRHCAAVLMLKTQTHLALPSGPQVFRFQRPTARKADVKTYALLSFFTNIGKKPAKLSQATKLLDLVSETKLGSATSPSLREEILETVEELCALQVGQPTTGSDLSATWKMAWTTEKVLETLLVVSMIGMLERFHGDSSCNICSLGDPLHPEECQVVRNRGQGCFPGKLSTQQHKKHPMLLPPCASQH